MRRSDLKLILETIRLRSLDHPKIKRCYDELLEAYEQTKSRPNWRIPIMPDLSCIEITSEEDLSERGKP